MHVPGQIHSIALDRLYPVFFAHIGIVVRTYAAFASPSSGKNCNFGSAF